MMGKAQVEELIEAVKAIPQELRPLTPVLPGVSIQEEDSLYVRTWSSSATPIFVRGRVRNQAGKAFPIELDRVRLEVAKFDIAGRCRSPPSNRAATVNNCG